MPVTHDDNAYDNDDNGDNNRDIKLDHPRTKALIPDIDAIMRRVPHCLASFAPGNADLWEEAAFAYFPRTCSASFWTMTMGKVVKADVPLKYTAEYRALLAEEVAEHLERVRALVAQPKSAQAFKLNPGAHSTCTAQLQDMVTYEEKQRAECDERIAALYATIDAARREVVAAERAQTDIMCRLFSRRRALTNAVALEAADAAARRGGRAMLSEPGCSI